MSNLQRMEIVCFVVKPSDYMDKDFVDAIDSYLERRSKENFKKLDNAFDVFQRALMLETIDRPEKMQLLRRLSLKQEVATVLLLYGFKRWEVAEIMDVKPATVKLLWIKARHNLTKMGLKELFNDEL